MKVELPSMNERFDSYTPTILKQAVLTPVSYAKFKLFAADTDK